jgi:hypothetical protein
MAVEGKEVGGTAGGLESMAVDRAEGEGVERFTD